MEYGGEGMRIPEFKNIEEEAEFWDTHDITDFLDDMELEDIKFIRKKPLTTISFRIEEDKAKELKRLARKLKIPYTVLIREIVSKALERIRI